MTISFPDPGLSHDDPRQAVYRFFESIGLTLLFMAPKPIEEVLDEALRVAPVLKDSSARGYIMRLNRDSGTFWVAVEGPYGSAVAVLCTPDSDSMLTVKEITMPLESASPAFTLEFMTLGKTKEDVIKLLHDYDVVPVTEFPAFQHLTDEVTLQFMPITARRAARRWQRLTGNLYKTTYEDLDDAQVFLTYMNGRVELWTPIGEERAPLWINALLDTGTYRIENLDPTVMLATESPPLPNEAALEAAARQLVADISSAFENARQSATPQPLRTTEKRGIWEHLENPPEGSAPGRQWKVPAFIPQVNVIERLRKSLPGDVAPEVSDNLTRTLRDQRQTGFDNAWRGGDETLLSPEWLTIQSAALDNDTGRIAAVALLNSTPTISDNQSTPDQDGIQFRENGEGRSFLWPREILYVGSIKTGVVVPLDATMDAESVDIYGPDGSVAVLHFLGTGVHAVTMFSASGEKRVLTTLKGLIGYESVRFSNDGQWLLIPRSIDSVLIEVSTGRSLVLGVPNTCWWPMNPSILMSVQNADGISYPTLFDLTQNTYVDSFPVIDIDVPENVKSTGYWHPSVSADGREVLICSGDGVTEEYRRVHGSGHRLIKFDIATGQGALVLSTFLNDDMTLERDISEPRWTQRPENTGSVVLHPILEARLQQPCTSHEYLTPGRWSDEAEILLVPVLNEAVNATRDGGKVAHLLPEILALLVPFASDPDAWTRQEEWLVGLRDTTTGFIAAGTIDGELAMFWQQYAMAISAIESGDPALIDPLVAAFVAAS